MKDEPLRIGIIGVRGRGKVSRYLHRPDGRSIVVGGADIRPENLDVFKAECNPDALTTEDYRELLVRDDIDAIVVTTPDFCHEEHAIAALEAGKPVYCEKPMATTIEACDRMIDVADRTGQKLMIGFNMRYRDYVLKMKELVDAGEIGEIKAVWIRHFVGRGSRAYFHDWHALKKNSTSLLLQKGTHDIDVMHFVTGRYTRKVAAFGGRDFFGGDKPNDLRCEECENRDSCLDARTRFKEAHDRAKQQFCAFRREVDVGDNYVCIMDLENRIRATYTECHFSPDTHRNYTFIGTRGRVENDTLNNRVLLWRRRSADEGVNEPDAVFDLTPPRDDPVAMIGHGGSDPKIFEDFVNMVLDDTPVPVPMLAGRMSVAVGVLAERSCEQGGLPQEIPAI